MARECLSGSAGHVAFFFYFFNLESCSVLVTTYVVKIAFGGTSPGVRVQEKWQNLEQQRIVRCGNKRAGSRAEGGRHLLGYLLPAHSGAGWQLHQR